MLSVIGVLALAGLGWVGFTVEMVPAAALKPVQEAPVAPAFAQPELLAEAAPELFQQEEPAAHAVTSHEALFFARREAGRSHIWAQQEGASSALPLTSGNWDNVDPAVSPDGRWLAFASNRDQGWDLYLLEISSGETRRLTQTPGYEGHPTWSPDSRWVAYETFNTDNFDIFILPIDGRQSPLQLTNHPGSDLSPTWDPQGRRIAFASNRDGSQDIYMADLDAPTDRFANLTASSSHAAHDPAFSPDGARLAYSARDQGVEGIWVLDLGQGSKPPAWVGLGGKPAWTVDGQAISGVLETPTRGHVVTYGLGAGVWSQGAPAAGRISRLSWAGVASNIASSELPPPAGALFEEGLGAERSPQGRVGLQPLTGVKPAGLVLSDAVDEAFMTLRSSAASALGWDFLGNLGYAFVGVNDPLPPGFAYNDWLYTGRAFAFNQAAFQAGWVEVVKEDFGAQTYWRVFVRTAQQDGTRGVPMHLSPWDFSTRYQSDPVAYDQGGSLKHEIPPGYYVDFTELAADFGFERVPALHNWRTFFPAARFDEFALTQGMDWISAMLEIYPASAIVTPTPYQTPTPTPSRTPRPTPTPWWWRWRTPTPSLTPPPPSTATPTPTP